MKELNPKGHQLTDEQKKNLPVLHERMNKVRTKYAQPMRVTSGLRSWEEHVYIYVKNGAIEYGLDGQIKVKRFRKFPRSSRHLSGAAVDILDLDGKLWGWCMDNLKFLEEVGLWLEDKTKTPQWVHFQIYPPASGNRVFLP